MKGLRSPVRPWLEGVEGIGPAIGCCRGFEDPLDLVMEQRMLRTIRRLAERGDV